MSLGFGFDPPNHPSSLTAQNRLKATVKPELLKSLGQAEGVRILCAAGADPSKQHLAFAKLELTGTILRLVLSC